MKLSIKILFAIFTMALFFVSCKNSDEPVIDELEGLTKIKEFPDNTDTYVIELYSQNRTTMLGYNDVSLRFKNKSTGEYEKNATASWLPVMHMISRSHSCPKSEIQKADPNGTLYNGYIVFQMAQTNEEEYWDITITFTINGTNYEAVTNIDVPVAPKRVVEVFSNSDNTRRYIVAFVEPKKPKVGVNDMIVGVWERKDMVMMDFPVVDAYTVKIDPRMPSMGNHSSPNNVDAKQSAPGGLYSGKLNLTMTGYWKINLQLMDQNGTVLKGEEIVDPNIDPLSSSSIYFEIEF